MNPERNKQIAMEFLAASAVHDGERFESLLTDDATYWVQGKRHLFPYSGEQTRAQICSYMHTPSIFKDGLKQTLGEITAEGNRVAVEVEVSGVAPNGKLYNNTFHYLLFFRDGKIERVKEYVDTYHAAEIFCS